MRHSLSGQIINWAGWTLRTRAPNPKNIVKSCPCEFWYDGADASTLALNVNKVIQWDDKSGFDRHVANAIDAQRPTYDPVTRRVTFVTANQTYLQSAAFGPLLQPNTIFILIKIIGNLGDSESYFDGLALPHHFSINANVFRFRAGAFLVNMATDANDNIHNIEVNGANSNYWINGANLINGNAGVFNLDGITIGAINALTNFSDVEIMEVFGYNCLLTAGERTALDAYLISKWSLPW